MATDTIIELRPVQVIDYVFFPRTGRPKIKHQSKSIARWHSRSFGSGVAPPPMLPWCFHLVRLQQESCGIFPSGSIISPHLLKPEVLPVAISAQNLAPAELPASLCNKLVHPEHGGSAGATVCHDALRGTAAARIFIDALCRSWTAGRDPVVPVCPASTGRSTWPVGGGARGGGA
jgi:hypothetical protein